MQIVLGAAAALTVLTTLCVGCARAPLTSAPQSTATDLVGAWQGACSLLSPPPTDGSAADPTSIQATVAFTATDAVLTAKTYPKTDCATLEYTTTITTSYVLSGPAAGGQQAQQIDYTMKSMMLLFPNPADIGELNDISFCGASDWQVNVAKDIAGRNCFSTPKPLPAAGDKIYDIFKIDGTSLRFGLSTADWMTPTGDVPGMTVATRPASLSPATSGVFNKITAP